MNSFLDLFTPARIKYAGLVGAAVADYWTPGAGRYVAWALLAFFTVLQFWPGLATLLLGRFKSYLTLPAWPEYVSIAGTAIAVSSKPQAWIVLVFLGVLGAGRLYNAIYP